MKTCWKGLAAVWQYISLLHQYIFPLNKYICLLCKYSFKIHKCIYLFPNMRCWLNLDRYEDLLKSFGCRLAIYFSLLLLFLQEQLFFRFFYLYQQKACRTSHFDKEKEILEKSKTHFCHVIDWILFKDHPFQNKPTFICQL